MRVQKIFLFISIIFFFSLIILFFFTFLKQKYSLPLQDVHLLQDKTRNEFFTVIKNIKLKGKNQKEIDDKIFNLAQKNLIAEICLEIKDNYYQTTCITEVAKQLKNKNFCNSLKNEKDKEKCINDVLVYLSIKNNDIKFCEKANSDKIYCVSTIAKKDNFKVENCELLNNQTLKDRCLSDFYYKKALAEKKQDYCNKISKIYIKALCFSYVNNVSLDSDLDNDGLSFLDEFYQGTDPNNKDTDGDGILDGEEEKKIYKLEIKNK